MANITALLAALSNLPPVSGGAPLTPLPAPVNAPTDFNLPQMLAGPEPPPMAPSMPLDQNLIAKYLGLAGPAPVQPPAPRPAGILDKIAAVLGGVSAGIQGQGPQFAASLRAERERPQREFEAKQAQYEQNRRQFGLAGLQAAESVEERRQARQDRAAERQFDRDFNEFTRRNNITDQTALEKMREAHDIQKLREQERIQDERQAARDRAQQERDARLIAKSYGTQAPPRIAQELGNYWAKLTDQLSPEAAKFESAHAKLEEAKARRLNQLAAGGGGGGSSVAAQKALAQFESVKQQVADANTRGDATAEMQLRRTMNAAFNRLARFPGQFDLGYDQSGQWPYAKPKGGGAPAPTQPGPGSPDWHAPMALPAQGQAAPTGGGKTITMDQLKASAAKAGISVNEAVKQFRDRGYSMRP